MTTTNNLDDMKLRDLSTSERPSFKIMNEGADALSEVELLSLIVGGNKVEDSLEIARRLFMTNDNSLALLEKYIYNTSQTQHASLRAAFELGRRVAREKEINRNYAQVINSSRTIFAQFNHVLSDIDHEELWALYCSKSGKILLRKCISEGGTDFTSADIKKIVKFALQVQASNVALCHNHPHSSIRPSRPDRMLTEKVKDALALFEIRLTDHVIISDGQYYSFADSGEL